MDVDLDKEVRNKFIGLGSKPFTDNQIKYGAKDVEYLIKIRVSIYIYMYIYIYRIYYNIIIQWAGWGKVLLQNL